ncbi:MAG: HAD family hydrolase [bacterium]|nr:HAD family hydrolase [bacterium]
MKKLKGVQAVITDADNTLYSWVEYIVPSLEAMVETLCRITKFDRDAIVASMKKVFSRHGTNEYAFVLQEAEIFEEMRRRDFNWFQASVVNPARFSFHRARKANLRAYPGVHRALQVLCSHGIRVIALSDAPAFPAEQRIKHLGLDKFLRALYALKSYGVPRRGEIDEGIINRMRLNYYRSRIARVVELPLSFEKPSTRGVRRILEEERLRPDRVVLIGDSLKKDVRIARETGIHDVWARYGMDLPEELMRRLGYYSAPEIQRRNVAQPGEAPYAATHTVDRFDRILDLIELPRRPMPCACPAPPAGSGIA